MTARTLTTRILPAVLLFVVCVVLFALLPVGGSAFYDWRLFFDNPATIPDYYPPWTAMVSWLPLPVVLALTVTAFFVAARQQARSVVSAACVALCLPLFWTLFLGQIDGLALWGVILLPYAVPLALMKPHLAAFALLARKQWVIAGALFILATIAIWGPWPLKLWTCNTDPAQWPQDIALGLWGLPIFALLVWQMPRDDPYWWMLAGAFVTPRLIPYNLLPLYPAAARLPWPWALAVALTSWLPFAANWVGDWGWYLGWVSVVLLGVGMWVNRSWKRERGWIGSTIFSRTN